MSTTTTNYGLVKPELTDVADITAMNPNWDIIDEKLHLIENKATTEPVEWKKGVNVNDLGTGYFYLDSKLEEGDWEVMGLPEKYGAGWAGAYLVIKGNADYGYEAYLRDFYDDTLWYTFLEGWSDTIWTQILTSEIGTLTEDLTIKKSYPRLELENTDNGRILAFLETDSYAQIANYLNTTNFRGIRIKPETEELESSVCVHEIVNGEVNNYSLFGEHNSNRTQLVSAETTPTKNNEIFWKYE